MAVEPGLAVRSRVRADRVHDFERWLRDAIETMAERVPEAPEILYFREWNATPTDSDGVDFIVLTSGSDISTLDLEPLLVEAYGAERAQVELADFESMLLGEQQAWTLQPITLE